MTDQTPPARAPRKLFIKTYGCQMNVYDSARMADVLAPQGFATTETPDDADMVILNTCHIREKAAEKVFSDLGRMRVIKDKRPGQDMTIAVAGCVAQAEGKQITTRAPFVDIVVGPQSYHRLPELVAKAGRKSGAVIDTDFPAEPKFDFLPPPTADGPAAFISVQEGCDKFCTFCVVPYTRGAEYSRPVADVLREARNLAAAGVREITLLGQNVNAYHGTAPDNSTWGLGRLIRALAEIDGLARIRYTTSHPRDMDDELMLAHRDVPHLMPFLHLPVQSGSDRILSDMNRQHTSDDFRRIVDKLRNFRPDMALSSDFIAGFPGETDDDFRATMDLIGDTKFAQAYCFKYSKRPGTPGAAMKNHVPETVKAERLAALQNLLDHQLREFNNQCVGREMDLLLTHAGRHDGQLVGKSPYLQAVHMQSNSARIGDIVRVRITEVAAYSLGAEAIDAKAA